MSDGRPLLSSLTKNVNSIKVDDSQAENMGTPNGKIGKNREKIDLKSVNSVSEVCSSESDGRVSTSVSAQSVEQDSSNVKEAIMASDPCIMDMSVSESKSCSFGILKPFIHTLGEKTNSLFPTNVHCFQRTSAPITPEKMKLISTASGSSDIKDSVTSTKRDFHVDSSNNLQYDHPLKRVRHEEEYEEDVTFTMPEDYTPRQWEWTRLGYEINNGKKVDGLDFTLMSYNVLSQDLLHDNIWLYPHCNEEFLLWDWRKKNLLYQFKKLKPDILCLQEVHKDHFREFYEPELGALGYKGRYLKRSGFKFDGCATFYKADKFIEEEVNTVEYSRIGNSLNRDNVALILKLKPIPQGQTVGKPADSQHDACNAEKEKSKANESGKPQESENICVANTHLLFNPKRGDVKLAQLMLLFAEIDKVSHKQNVASGPTSYSPVIVCGDFNTEPQSDIYKFVVRGFLHFDGLLSNYLSGQRQGHRGKDRALPRNFFPSNLQISDQCQFINLEFERLSTTSAPFTSNGRPFFPSPSTPISEDGVVLSHDCIPYMSQQTGYLWHHLNLVSAYKHKLQRYQYRKKEVTTHHYGADCTVDYIFYNVNHRDIVTRQNEVRTSNIMEGKLKLVGRYGLLSSDELQAMESLPNAFNPSDHLPIMVRFLWSS